MIIDNKNNNMSESEVLILEFTIIMRIDTINANNDSIRDFVPELIILVPMLKNENTNVRKTK